MEKQRARRANEAVMESERAQARERWSALPEDHPRKTRKPTRTVESIQRKREKENGELPRSVVAGRYLGMRTGECPEELIELKRECIKLGRAVRRGVSEIKTTNL